jgi:Plavaka transposase
MARYLSPLYWEAIRRRCPSQLVKMNFILYTYRMGTSATMFGVRIVMASTSSGFFPSPKVSMDNGLCILVCPDSCVSQADRKYQNDDRFRMFRRQLFHSSLGTILEPLRPAMTTPEVTRCPDGHFRRVIYGLGPYIADYPEQVLLACVVQGWCPK